MADDLVGIAQSLMAQGHGDSVLAIVRRAAREQLASARAQADELAQANSKLRAENNTLANVLVGLTSDVKALTATKAKLVAECDSLRDEIAHITAQLDALCAVVTPGS